MILYKMNQDRIRNIINENIDKVLLERRNEIINKIVKESLTKILNEEDLNTKRNFVISSLGKPGIKLSEFAYALWPNMDKDTARGLISHKIKNNSFTENEINKLYQLIRKI